MRITWGARRKRESKKERNSTTNKATILFSVVTLSASLQVCFVSITNFSSFFFNYCNDFSLKTAQIMKTGNQCRRHLCSNDSLSELPVYLMCSFFDFGLSVDWFLLYAYFDKSPFSEHDDGCCRCCCWLNITFQLKIPLFLRTICIYLIWGKLRENCDLSR